MGLGVAKVKKCFVRSQAVLSMVLVQLFVTGLQLLSRVVLNEGTFVFALMAYRQVVAAICVAPFAFFLERKNAKKMNWVVWSWLFASALTGITITTAFYYFGLKDTTATYATNFLNLIPVVTFILSIVAGVEQLQLNTRAGKMKVFGAILCVGGALTTSLYKGKDLHIGHHASHSTTAIQNVNPHWVRGSLLLIGSCVSSASWFLVQVKLLKVLPFKYFATMLTCGIASLQSAVVGLCINREASSWRLGWNLQLFTIVYSGALASAATFCLISYAIKLQGPTYPPMFNPLALVFVAVLEALILGQALAIGTVLGAILIIVGLYSFLWGKRGESKSLLQLNVTGGEATTRGNEPAQLTAIVMPTDSPNSNSGDDGIKR